jgi:hypothetical protein
VCGRNIEMTPPRKVQPARAEYRHSLRQQLLGQRSRGTVEPDVAERQRERMEIRSVKAPRRRGQAERHMFKLN